MKKILKKCTVVFVIMSIIGQIMVPVPLKAETFENQDMDILYTQENVQNLDDFEKGDSMQQEESNNISQEESTEQEISIENQSEEKGELTIEKETEEIVEKDMEAAEVDEEDTEISNQEKIPMLQEDEGNLEQENFINEDNVGNIDNNENNQNIINEEKSSYVQETSSFEEFADLTVQLVNENDFEQNDTISSDENFSDMHTKRVIVKATDSNLSFSEYSAIQIIKSPDNVYILQFAEVSDAERAIEQLNKLSNVVYAEMDEYIQTDIIQSNRVTSVKNSWGVSKIGADKYAKYVSKITNKEIIVAVVDSGVDVSHPFFKGRIAQGGYSFINEKNQDDTNGNSDVSDLVGHGTHVAGTVVDCTPGLNVKILPIKVLKLYTDSQGHRWGRGTNLIFGLGIEMAVKRGAKVINYSIGGDKLGSSCSGYLDEKIKKAIEQGVNMVVSAGNDRGNTEEHCPAHMRDVIVVGAVDSNYRKADFSNFGNTLDVVAPGVGINSCNAGGGYILYDGTSMAAPHVSAAVAMYRLVYPLKTPAEIEELIKKHTLDLGEKGWDRNYGNGFIQMSDIKFGDVYKDGEVDLTDLMSILRHIRASEDSTVAKEHPEWILKYPQVNAADVNGDNRIDENDTDIVLKHIHRENFKDDEYILSIVTVRFDSNEGSEVPDNIPIIWRKSQNTYYKNLPTVSRPGYQFAGWYTAKNGKGRKISNGSKLTSDSDHTLYAYWSNESVSLNTTDLLLYTNQKFQLKTNISNMTGKVLWLSDDTRIATVNSSGLVQAINAGTTWIHAKVNGKIVSCRVSVKQSTIALNKSSASIVKGKTLQLKATIVGASQKVSWKSSNTSIATVSSNGLITGKKKGTVTITATANGVSKTAKITVTNPTITLNKKSLSMLVGEAISLKARIVGASQKVSWKSSNSNIASVSSKGLVTAKKSGTVTITATANGVKASIKVTVNTTTDLYKAFMKRNNMNKKYYAIINVGENKKPILIIADNIFGGKRITASTYTPKGGYSIAVYNLVEKQVKQVSSQIAQRMSSGPWYTYKNKLVAKDGKGGYRIIDIYKSGYKQTYKSNLSQTIQKQWKVIKLTRYN